MTLRINLLFIKNNHKNIIKDGKQCLIEIKEDEGASIEIKTKLKQQKLKIRIMIVLCSILHYLFLFLDTTYRFIGYSDYGKTEGEVIASKYNGFLFVVLEIAVFCPLNRFVLNYPIYLHHKFAIIFFVVGSFIYCFEFIFKGEINHSIPMFLLGFLFNCLQIVMEKLLMEEKY